MVRDLFEVAMTVWFVPRDSAARSVGADEVADALVDYGHTVVQAVAVDCCGWNHWWSGSMTTAPVLAGATSRPMRCPVREFVNLRRSGRGHRLLARQDRWIFERMGITDPIDPEDYLAHGGMMGLRAALAMSASDVVDSVIDSGLRGRGGALSRRNQVEDSGQSLRPVRTAGNLRRRPHTSTSASTPTRAIAARTPIEW